jgi:hypothetical protein
MAVMGYSKGVKARKYEAEEERGRWDPKVMGDVRRMMVPIAVMELVHKRARVLSADAGFRVFPGMALLALLEPKARTAMLGRLRGLKRVTLEHVIEVSDRRPIELDGEADADAGAGEEDE